MTTSRRLKLKIYGMVQGVFFRESAAAEARRLGVDLIIARNEPDRSVYMEAEGGEKALDEFLAWCRHGPPAAKVERVMEL